MLATVLAVVVALPFFRESLYRPPHRIAFSLLCSALPRRFLASVYLRSCLCNLAPQPFISCTFGCARGGCIRYYFFLATFFRAGFLLVAFFLAGFRFVAFFFVALRFATFFLAAFLRVAFFFVAFFFVAFFFVAFFFAAFLLVAFFFVAFFFVAFFLAGRLFATFFLVAFFLVAFFLATRLFAAVFFRLADFFFAAFFFAFAITKAPLKDLIEIKTQHHGCLYTLQQHDVQTIIVENF